VFAPLKVSRAGEGLSHNSFGILSSPDLEDSANSVGNHESGVQPQVAAATPTTPQTNVRAGEGGNVTRFGRQIQTPIHLTYNVPGQPSQSEVAAPTIGLTEAEAKYYAMAAQFPSTFGYEMCLVGAGLGGGFIDTHELHVMKYDEAMATKDAPKWEKAVDKEHDQMAKAKVFKPVPIDEVPDDTTTRVNMMYGKCLTEV
jgi:hypothetical protein